MPLWPIGKRREALTGNSEVYKRKIVQFLERRGYYLKAGSNVESTFADCILTKKNEEREYWLEAKATTISLGHSSFLVQLGKYLSEYLRRTPQNRFKMMIACYNVISFRIFERVFDEFNPEAINGIVNEIINASEPNLRSIIMASSPEEIRNFFEETTVIIANPSELEIAEEKIIPRAPIAPSLSEAEYAAELIDNFGEVEPLRGPDKVNLNLFKIEVPDQLYIAKTPYSKATSIFSEKPDIYFPSFRLENSRIYSFSEMNEGSLLGDFIDPESLSIIDLKEFDKDENNSRILIKLLNIWIKNKCKKHRLLPDERTGAYYFPKEKNGYNPITVIWTPKHRRSEREMTKPMMTNGKINYWVHRAANIFARRYWGEYYLQIRPRWLFSLDGKNPFGDERADTLDRSFRKSLYNRNLNQYYDVLFWYRLIFSETDVQGTLKLDSFLESSADQRIKLSEQVSVQSERRPPELEEEIEEFDKIEPIKTLDEYFGGEE